MKKLLFIAITVVLTIGCNPNNVTPTLSQLEADLIGEWEFIKQENFAGGSNVPYYTFTPNCIDSKIEFTSTISGDDIAAEMAIESYELVNNRLCGFSAIKEGWKGVDATHIIISNVDYEVTLTSTTLRLEGLTATGESGGGFFYYEKI